MKQKRCSFATTNLSVREIERRIGFSLEVIALIRHDFMSRRGHKLGSYESGIIEALDEAVDIIRTNILGEKKLRYP